MEQKIIDSMRDFEQHPAEFITLMFERTDEDGILYIPGWHYNRPGWEWDAPGSTEENDSYRCKIDWNLEKHEKVKEKFEKVYSAIEEISKSYDELFCDNVNPEEIFDDPQILEFYKLYLEPLDTADFDLDKIDEISEKLSMLAWVKSIGKKVAKGEKLEDYEKDVLTENVDLSVSEEELKYRQNYLNHLLKQVEAKLGNNICAYDVRSRAWRVCRLFSLGAPKIIVENEAKQLAAAFVLHEYGISRELVDDRVRLRLEEMELMSEEELDELYRPQRANSQKSLAPLFVFEILRKKSDSKTHLRQADIQKELARYPYEVSLERKAISRIIHNLIDNAQYGVFADKTGVWIDQENKG